MGNKSTEIRVKYENILSHDIEELLSRYRLKEKKKDFCWVRFSCHLDDSYGNKREKKTLLEDYGHTKEVNMSAEYRDRCCKNKRRENNKMFCNDTQEIGSLQSMACNMLKLLETKQKFNKEFRRKAALVSCRTLRVLTCKCEEDKIDKVCKQLNMPKNEDVVETAEQPRRKCNQAFCKLKENISSLRSCWNKFEKMISR
ncbi:hypothetical protein ASZ78_010747 [Callipepla squamata]|uniref:Interleukin-7 n=1 Tax=Callipepla squamata TaxID=9009 RepID=A0A226N1U6_CALSU|nr:hypothetical protein ASZ78_010747 [Callipepla squamata]